ncbi:hypothetical protein [Sphaerotilus sp.]|uniref:hypothetical protein n=1 Tax=Sphaerotilus sp. TaxID=2093942 RepID=UPI0034E2C9F8
MPMHCRFVTLLALLGVWMGTVSAQPTSATEVEPRPATPVTVLRFSEFFASPIGIEGLQLTDQLRAAAGRRVRITGYMVAQEFPRPGRFFLTPRPLVMSEHADGDADDLPPSTVVVILPPAESDLTPMRTRGLLQLTGTLSVGRQELDDGRVSWVRLALEPRSASAE